MISRIFSSDIPIIIVSIVCLFGGGVLIIDKSLAPNNENCNVLGIGVALNVSVSIFSLKSFSLSLIFTPNFCSSSIIIRPKSRNFTSLPTILWVPIRISIFPCATFSSVIFCSFFDLNLFM